MSLLSDEVLAWVGHSVSFQSDLVAASDIRGFIAASGDDNPAYHPGGPNPIAPPMLYYAVTRPFVPSDAFGPDGTVSELRPMVGKGQTMGGEVEMEWLKPVKQGDRLEGTRTLVSLTEKDGKTFPFVIAEWKTEYRDAAGRLMVRERYEQLLF